MVFVLVLCALVSCEEEKAKSVGEIVKARLDVSCYNIHHRTGHRTPTISHGLGEATLSLCF